MRMAVVIQDTGLVANVIEIEEGSPWQPPVDCVLVSAEATGSPGDTWDGQQFISPEPEEEE